MAKAIKADIQDEELDRNPRNLENDSKPNLQARNPRVRAGRGGKLTVPQRLIEKGYRYYWGIDRPGEIEQLIEAGYEYVNDNGQKFSVHAGAGNKHYLLRIPQEYYDEDQAAYLAELQETTYQQARIGSGEYAPTGRGIEGEGVAIKRERDLI